MKVNSKKLLERLYSIITPEKREKFDLIASERTRHLTVAVENLYQEHNASAVVRSCDCFGIQDVHIIEKTNSFQVNREISMGAAKWVNHRHYFDVKYPTQKCISTLKEKGYKIVATTPHDTDRTINNIDLKEPIALFFGTEKSGLSETAFSLADEHIKIPMYGFTESFNISVSAAICMQVLRQRLEEQDEFNWKLSEEEQINLKIDWCKNIVKNPEKAISHFTKDILKSENAE